MFKLENVDVFLIKIAMVLAVVLWIAVLVLLERDINNNSINDSSGISAPLVP